VARSSEERRIADPATMRGRRNDARSGFDVDAAVDSMAPGNAGAIEPRAPPHLELAAWE
jgi:hypothetical protein